MSKKLKLKIITPQRVLLEEEVESVYSITTSGEVGILPDHVAYMTPLDIGVTRYEKSKQKEFVSVIGGILQVKDNIVTILSNNAEIGDQIDVARANAARERAEALLKLGKDVDVERARAALTRALTRIRAASRKAF